MPGSSRRESFCTSCAWRGASPTGTCQECGSAALAEVSHGAVIELPAGYRPCLTCGKLEEPLVFRGSVRLASLIWIARETRRAGYYCGRCAQKQAAGNLAFTGLLGWWGFLSVIFWAPRATYHNWRAVWRPPRRPLAWGAVDAAALAEELRARREPGWSAFGATDLFAPPESAS